MGSRHGSNGDSEQRLPSQLEFVDEVVSDAMNRQRDFLVHTLAARLIDANISVAEAADSSTNEEWTEIESMSRLRSMVGGRFQNLKARWVEAGFPLRAHRGDKKAEFKVDELGWIELSNWISKQGFEVRLRPDKKHCLFEIRQGSLT